MSRDSLRALEVLALVGVGGFAGANLRYAVASHSLATNLVLATLGRDAVSLAARGLLGTLAVNAVGSLALGFLVYEAVGDSVLSEGSRTVLATGFLSSFTTYSTFAVQTAGVSPPLMVANVAANYLLGFAGVVAGRALATRYGGGA
ncbi:fluoride efflux transporter FluC [Halobacterium zhouii]|uniref:fluoride efflux transporter FluC n=1 Tax=Halobacterium zhouii TaxID=2902624 RepID=UPI001E3CB438|nr:CrcB family protein [Halobacterium zhouii]